MIEQKKIQLIILAIVAVLILVITFGCNGLSGVQYHRNLQEQLNYEQAINRNTAYSLKNAKEALRQAKKDARIQEKLKRDIAKRQAIWDKIQELKKDN